MGCAEDETFENIGEVSVFEFFLFILLLQNSVDLLHLFLKVCPFGLFVLFVLVFEQLQGNLIQFPYHLLFVQYEFKTFSLERGHVVYCRFGVGFLGSAVDVAFVEFGSGDGEEFAGRFWYSAIDHVLKYVSILCVIRMTLR